MASQPEALPHLILTGTAVNQPYQHRGGGGGDPAIRDVVDRRVAHGTGLRSAASKAFDEAVNERRLLDADLQELKARGTFITIVAAPDFLLKLDSLDSAAKDPEKRPWFLVSVSTDPGGIQQAVIWVRDSARPAFLKRFEKYAAAGDGPDKAPLEALMANIAEVRRTLLEHMWTSGRPPAPTESGWWELWLDDSNREQTLAAIEAFVERRNLRLAKRRLSLGDVRVVWVHARWMQLQELLSLHVPLAEIRRPRLVESLLDLAVDEQREYVDELADRLTPSGADAPAVCLLDTGVDRGHPLLGDSLAATDHHFVIGASGDDRDGHGTEMAGVALFGGRLAEAIESTEQFVLTHRLESVRLLPGRGTVSDDAHAFGVMTADAVSQPEITAPGRPRVFSLLVTAPGPLEDHQATLWSATLDALSAGANVARQGDDLAILTEPNGKRARLIVVSAGNVRPADGYAADHIAVSALAAIEEPAQAQNALTVGAFTGLAQVPAHPDFQGWVAVAAPGDLSPFSRTSVSQAHLPLKPDICMEGGNLLTDGADEFSSDPAVSVLTTARRNGIVPAALTHTNATSAATAQAARLAARVMVELPGRWPETVRGLVVHSARWTEPMMTRVQSGSNQRKDDRATWLRHFGWGVPDEERLLRSARQAVTMISEDTFIPFETAEHSFARCRIHRLPWPTEALEELGAETVRLRVTLSYFIEPNARRRGWKARYAYESHGLRFALKRPTENDEAFLRRVTNSGKAEEGKDGWLVGPQARDRGSLHQDIWSGTGADLAQQGALGVFPVAGWWKRNQRADRADREVRYSLIVSIETDRAEIDLYTPVLAQIDAAADISV